MIVIFWFGRMCKTVGNE